MYIQLYSGQWCDSPQFDIRLHALLWTTVVISVFLQMKALTIVRCFQKVHDVSITFSGPLRF